MRDKIERVLAIETSLKGCGAAYYDAAGDRVSVKTIAMEYGQAEHLMPCIENVLKEADAAYTDIHAIICVTGPGSFTGLRVGLSAARGLALALSIPLYGVTSLQALASEYIAAHDRGFETLAVVIDTKRDDYYVQVFDIKGQKMSEALCLTPAQTQEMLAPYQNLRMIGDAAERLGDAVPALRTAAANPALHIIHPGFLARFFQAHGLNSDVFTPAPLPVYLRPADVSQPKNKIPNASSRW